MSEFSHFQQFDIPEENRLEKHFCTDSRKQIVGIKKIILETPALLLEKIQRIEKIFRKKTGTEIFSHG